MDSRRKPTHTGDAVSSRHQAKQQTHNSSAKNISPSQNGSGHKPVVSKFNRILSNIERSIFSHIGATNSSDSNTLKKKKQSSVKPQQCAKTHTGNDSKPDVHVNHHLFDNHDTSAKRNDPQDPCNRSMTTLNKFQQQLISTMRPNQTIMVNNSSSKLSIPPPHACDEARNQTHQVLFGETPSPRQIFEPDNRTTVNNVANDELKSNMSGGSVITNRLSDSSPARFEQRSLSSQQQNLQSRQSIGSYKTDDIVEHTSGFASYQPRQQLSQPNMDFANQNIHSVQSNSNQQVSKQFLNSEAQMFLFQNRPQDRNVSYVFDNSQQIYANAPPKPRRYQYYDQGQLVAQVNVPQTYQAPWVCNSGSVSGYNSPNQNPIAVRPNYNAAYNQRANFNFPNQSRAYHSQVGHLNPPRLLKSKSNLEAHHVDQYRDQSKPTSSQLRQYDFYLQSAMNSAVLPQGSLLRSKSVTHLVDPSNQSNQHVFPPQSASSNVRTLIGSSGSRHPSFASTTHLNLSGPVGERCDHQSNYNNVPNLNQLQLYHSSIETHNNQMLSSAALRSYHQRRMNNWTNHQNDPQDPSCSRHNRPDPSNNGSFVNSNAKINRQPQSGLSDMEAARYGKPSLDDKIKNLLITEDNEASKFLSMQSLQSSGATAYSNRDPQACSTNFPKSQPRVASGYTLTRRSHNGQPSEANPIVSGPSNPVSIMGNCQQKNYPVTQHITVGEKTLDLSETNHRGDTGSQLIVDLTTPRVLAKTQTTLSSANNRFDSRTPDARTMNSVGLPTALHVPSLQNSLTNVSGNQAGSQGLWMNRSCSKLSGEMNIERSAPYYYSDLRSEDQRLALLNIVQQKSLSPPPKLLSRSIDHNNTRLAPKPQMIPSNLLQSDHEVLTQGKHQFRSAIEMCSNDCCSNPNIAKNIDKLFESSGRTNILQSMFALNDPKNKLDSNHQDDTNATTVPSSDSKNLSKSKSLENISQKPLDVTFNSNGLRNPVYENIRRSDKLMSAINSSTTCLSSSSNQRVLRRHEYQSVSSSSNSSSTSDSNRSTDSRGSLDSILSSSLDGSNSESEDFTTLKTETTGNHLRDVSQLIEQLKINQAKLSKKYKSTLTRISKTIDAKRRQPGCGKDEKISKRLRKLETKCKKCETRGRNQLALISKMENIVQQAQITSNNGGLLKKLEDRPEESKPSTDCDESSKTTQPDNSAKLEEAITLMSTNDPSIDSKTPNVTENGTSPMANSSVSAHPSKHNDQRHFRVAQSSYKSAIFETPESKTKKAVNAFSTGGSVDSNNDSRSSSTTSHENDPCEQANLCNPCERASQRSTLLSSPDDEDFIEYLSMDESSHRSQFEASQFSASDFNTSNSASDSSTSGVASESLDSSKNGQHMYNKAGILKGPKSDHFGESPTNRKSSGHEAELKRKRFDNMLGNVIDVDVSPANNPLQSSPVGEDAPS